MPWRDVNLVPKHQHTHTNTHTHTHTHTHTRQPLFSSLKEHSGKFQQGDQCAEVSTVASTSQETLVPSTADSADFNIKTGCKAVIKSQLQRASKESQLVLLEDGERAAASVLRSGGEIKSDGGSRPKQTRKVISCATCQCSGG